MTIKKRKDSKLATQGIRENEKEQEKCATKVKTKQNHTQC